MVASTATANGAATNGHTNGHSNGNGKDELGAKIVAAVTAVPGVGIKATTNGNSHAEVYKVQETPFETRRPIRVICMGAGFSGLYLAYRLQQRCENVELVIYEKNHDVGGTWLENTYPGVACDIPAHVYCYSFLPNTAWSTHYAPGNEILAYLRRCADIFKARQYIKFNHKVTSAIWDDETGKWNLKLDNNGQTVEDSAEIFINGGGFLNAWKWPEIAGLQSFKGTLLHSAQWDDNVDYENKRVAVIGSGSSAVQIIPNMRPKVAHMDAYIRSSTYVPPPLAEDFLHDSHAEDYLGDLKYTEADRKRFAEDPNFLKSYRKTIESQLNGFFATFHTGCKENLEFRELAVEHMKKKLQNRPDLVKLLIPNWDIGCRRVSPGLGFLEALTEENVEVVSKEIQEITPEGIVAADGKERKVDIIVCATGFDCSWRPRFTLKGRNGYQIGDKWAEEPRSYMSIAIEEMPNYFIFNGPYNCGGNGAAIPPIEVEGDYMIECINKIQRQNIKSMTPQMSAIEEFAEHADAIMLRTTWSGTCRNWYRTRSGRVVGTWPGSGLIFQRLMKNPRWEDYEYEHVKFPDSKLNRFSFIGNGYTHDYGTDMAPYLNADPEQILA